MKAETIEGISSLNNAKVVAVRGRKKGNGYSQAKIKQIKAGKKFPYVSTVIIILFFLNAIFCNVIAPHNPTEMTLSAKLLPPAFMGGSAKYLLGTDSMGRDILSRILVGGRVAVIVCLSAIIIGGIFGTALGIIAGWFQGAADTIIMRITDASLAFPSILLALLLSLSIGPGVKSAIISIAFSMWATYTRTVRSKVRVLKNENFVRQAKIMGASDISIIFRHIIPNVLDTVEVLVSLDIGKAILTEASLSFLGLSVVPPTPSWGQMISDGNTYFLIAWWISVFPALAIIIVVLAFQRFGRWMQSKKGGAV